MLAQRAIQHGLQNGLPKPAGQRWSCCAAVLDWCGSSWQFASTTTACSCSNARHKLQLSDVCAPVPFALACVCLLAAETAAMPAAMASTNSSSTPKDAMTHGHHVTATAHSGIAVDHADLALDTAPGGSDQARKHADYAPASAAAASSIDAVMAAKLNSQNKQDQAIVRPGHMPHPDLKHLLASAHNRPYTGAPRC